MKPIILGLKTIVFSCCLLMLTGLHAQILRQGKNYVPNQVLIKLKDDITLQPEALKNNGTGVDEVDKVLRTFTLKKVTNIFLPSTENKLTVSLNSLSTKTTQITDNKNKRANFLQLAFDKDSIDVLSLVAHLKLLPSVEFAEPNYIFSLDATMNQPIQAVQLKQQKKLWSTVQPIENNVQEKLLWSTGRKLDFLPPVVSPNDPLFSQQNNLTSANVQKAWEVTTGDSTVVAVIDTGVDWMHADLKDNIWINWAEYFGQPGVDDDGDGLIDDIRGWDFVNNDNDPTDDHSHGTHVAGIIAAKGNNGIGISGVNWNAKIMCLKVLQSTGRGDAATIAKAVDYAANKGAKIINLSLGGYYESLTFKSSLQNAYAKCLIVAAAGNDQTCIGPGKCPDGAPSSPIYPGSYSFVMGGNL